MKACRADRRAMKACRADRRAMKAADRIASR
jgi:hypothetical protein